MTLNCYKFEFCRNQCSRIRSVRILFFERYVRTLMYSILAYVNNNRMNTFVIEHQQFWFYVKFNLIRFRDSIFHHVTDLRKVISGLLTYLLR